MIRSALFAAALVAGAGLAPAPLPAQIHPAAGACRLPALDSAEVMRDVSRLADDSMLGRRLGTPGNAKARDFIAARFDALGLRLAGGERIRFFPVARPGLQDVARGRTSSASSPARATPRRTSWSRRTSIISVWDRR